MKVLPLIFLFMYYIIASFILKYIPSNFTYTYGLFVGIIGQGTYMILDKEIRNKIKS